MSEARVEVSSVVPLPRAEVWGRVSTLAGVNHELAPVLRMSGPQDVSLAQIAVTPGEPFAVSTLLLLGAIPVGRSRLTLVRVEEGRGFLERSPMTGMSHWEHERTLSDEGSGCRVTDRLTARPVLPVPASLVRAIVRALFRHRHRRLARWAEARASKN